MGLQISMEQGALKSVRRPTLHPTATRLVSTPSMLYACQTPWLVSLAVCGKQSTYLPYMYFMHWSLAADCAHDGSLRVRWARCATLSRHCRQGFGRRYYAASPHSDSFATLGDEGIRSRSTSLLMRLNRISRSTPPTTTTYTQTNVAEQATLRSPPHQRASTLLAQQLQSANTFHRHAGNDGSQALPLQSAVRLEGQLRARHVRQQQSQLLSASRSY